MSEQRFDPIRYLTRLNGKEYLEVKWRLVWFRTACPLGAIETECIFQDETRAVFKATVRANTLEVDDKVVTDVPALAVGHGSETAGDFRDYLEKAETKAIGRALAALGFGTQFTDDHDFGAAQGRVVDAPVQRSAPPTERQPARGNVAQVQQQRHESAPVAGKPAQPKPYRGSNDRPMSDAQRRRLMGPIANQQNMTDEDVRGQVFLHFGVQHIHEMTTREASWLMDELEAGRIVEGSVPPPPRADPQEANQQGYDVPEEPEWLREGPAGDRYTA